MVPIILTTHQLSSTRFVFKIPTRESIPFTFSATRFSGFNEGMPWEAPKNLDEMEAPFQQTLAAWNKGEGYSFMIADRSTQELRGRISIRKTDRASVWNIGFWTHPEHQGKGIMTEAVARILQFGFQELDATRIEAAHATWNQASRKVLMSNKFQFSYHIEQGFLKRGKWVGEDLLAIDRKDWIAAT
ncbi:MAG: GNAT family N-acetyltransferase [Bacteroidota bacterium]